MRQAPGCYLTREVRLILGYRSRNHYSSTLSKTREKRTEKNEHEDITWGSIHSYKQEESVLSCVPYRIATTRSIVSRQWNRFDFPVQRQRDSSCFVGHEWRSSSLARALSYFTRPCSCDSASPSFDAKNTEAKKSKWNFCTSKRAIQRVHCASYACPAALHAHRSRNCVKGEKVIFGSWESGSKRFEISTIRATHEVFVWDIDCVWRGKYLHSFIFSILFSAIGAHYFWKERIWKKQSNASIHFLKRKCILLFWYTFYSKKIFARETIWSSLLLTLLESILP